MARSPKTPKTSPAAVSFDSSKHVQEALYSQHYIASDMLSTAVFLALQLRKPLLLEGPSGVGKTEVAKTLARLLKRELIRLQCYEGIDESHALYDWAYQKQLLSLQLLEGKKSAQRLNELYSQAYLIERPLLRAIRSAKPVVLLIDEIDRAEPELEALLLELLGEKQVTIPELGTLHAQSEPLVILTSNASRELSDALRRRCLFAMVGYPLPSEEAAIIRAQIPAIGTAFSQQLVHAVNRIRQMDVQKKPGVAETLEWARSLVVLHAQALDQSTIEQTLGVLLKAEADMLHVREHVDAILDAAQTSL